MRLTKKPWFGPKAYVGWGWRPVSPEGWVVALVILACIIAAGALWQRSTTGIIAVVLLIGVFYVVARLTGDPPGGHASR